MIAVRPARSGDAAGIGAVHVAAWRSAYAGILPDAFLARLSLTRQAAQYEASIHARRPVFVAVDGERVVGFATAGRPRTEGLADGEVETLYVLDDFRDRGLGRRLLRAAAARLSEGGCRSAFLWVLRDNPSRWFYQRLRGRPAMGSTASVAGISVPQVAYVWDPIELLLPAPAQP